MATLTAYELDRQERIKMNLKRMQQVGLHETMKEIQVASARQKSHRKPPAMRQKRKALPGKKRASDRNNGRAPQYNDALPRYAVERSPASHRARFSRRLITGARGDGKEGWNPSNGLATKEAEAAGGGRKRKRAVVLPATTVKTTTPKKQQPQQHQRQSRDPSSPRNADTIKSVAAVFEPPLTRKRIENYAELTTEEDDDEEEECDEEVAVEVEEASYLVERIAAVCEKPDGTKLYLIKWQGYDASENTWEPAESLHAPPESYKRKAGVVL